MEYIDHIPSIHDSERTASRPVLSLNDVVSSAQATDEIQGHVRRALRIAEKPYRKHTDAETLVDSVRLNQVTKCLGYTIVGSECLERAAEAVGPHYILFVNGHALLANTSEDEHGMRLHSLDFMKPAVNTDITPGIDISISQLIAQTKDVDHPRGAARLNTQAFVTAEHSFDSLAYKNSWLYSGNSNTILQSDNRSSTDPSAFKLILSIYEPAVGRKVLEQYDAFRQAVMLGQPMAAASSLHQMHGLYPEIDARQKHTEIKTLVGQLAARQEVTLLRQVIADYTLSFVRSQDSRLLALEAGLYRIGAETLNDSSLGELAICAYERAASQSSRRSNWQIAAWHAQAAMVRNRFTQKQPTILT
jgi:hypothetical protein